MSDRELLGLAAKAAGYDVVWATDLNGFVFRPFGHGPRTMFSPLNDDGDALRLAVKLDIWVHPGDGRECVEVIGCKAVYLEAGECRAAATRRAIVRAAAEIGKAMP